MPSLLGGDPLAVMLAVHDEAPGRDGDEVFEAGLDPVLGLDRVEGDALGDIRAGGIGHEFADQRLIRRLGKMHGDVPAAVRPLERGDRGLAFKKNFGQHIDDAPWRLCSSPIAKLARWVGAMEVIEEPEEKREVRLGGRAHFIQI